MFSTLRTKIGTLSKNYQFRLDIPLADCYNIKVLKTEAEMLRSWFGLQSFVKNIIKRETKKYEEMGIFVYRR